MRLKCIACEVFARPLYKLAARSPNTIDIHLIEKAKHNWPQQLRQMIQSEIDQNEPEKYDAIIMAYGLCGKSLEGIGSKDIPIVIPRAHDCITLYLGSRQRYQEEFEREPGTFWYIHDYVERSAEDEVDGFGGPGVFSDSNSQFQEFVAKYGEDNAIYLMEEMGGWQAHYKRAVYINTGLDGEDRAISRAKERAHSRGWTYQQLQGDLKLIEKLLNGSWDSDFLILEPGKRVEMSNDDDVIRIQPDL